ncbi:MAG TPA: hypothetical protein VMI35_12360 [Puia sp.]|nr:hypothetical protein [Puia sp.]
MITIAKKSLKVGKYVDNQHVDAVIRTYKQERWVHNSKRIGKEDSLSAWYSVEELEEFIANAKDHGADGIKFYFATYPVEFQEKPEYAGRQSLVLVATRSREAEDGTTVNKDIYVPTGDTPQILAYNLAKICPPSCGGTFADSDLGDLGITIVDCGEKGMSMI